MLHIHLRAAGLLAGGFEPGPVNVADRDRRGFVLPFQVIDDVEVRLGPPPVPMKPMPILSLAPFAVALRIVNAGATAAAPAALEMSRRVGPMASPAGQPLSCLTHGSLLLKKRRTRATSPPERGLNVEPRGSLGFVVRWDFAGESPVAALRRQSSVKACPHSGKVTISLALILTFRVGWKTRGEILKPGLFSARLSLASADPCPLKIVNNQRSLIWHSWPEQCPDVFRRPETRPL